MAEYEDDAELEQALKTVGTARQTPQQKQRLVYRTVPKRGSSNKKPQETKKSPQPARSHGCCVHCPCRKPSTVTCPEEWTVSGDYPRNWLRRKSKVLKNLKEARAGKTTHGEDGGPVPWIKTHVADTFFASMIVLSAIVAGIDVEVTVRGIETSDGFDAFLLGAQIFFNLVFCTELALRLRTDGFRYILPCNPIGFFDFVVIVLGVVDLAITLAGNSSSSIRAVGAFRVLRMLRLVRIVRLLLICRSLRLLFVAMFSSVSAVIWTMVLLGVMIFIGALFCVILLGNVREIDAYFGTVTLGLFTHFQIVTLEAWPEISDATMKAASPVWGLYFIVFIVLTGMAVTNLVVGIIGERLMGAREEDRGQMELRSVHESVVRNCRQEFQELFYMTNVTRSGFLDTQDAGQFLRHPDMRNILSRLEVSQDISNKELVEVVTQGSEQDKWSCDNLFKGVLQLRGSAAHLHSVILQHEHAQFGLRQVRGVASVEEAVCLDFDAKLAEANSNLTELLRSIACQQPSSDLHARLGPAWENDLRQRMDDMMQDIDGIVAETDALLGAKATAVHATTNEPIRSSPKGAGRL